MPLDVVAPNRAARKQESNFEIRPLRYTVRDVSTLLRCTKVFVYQLIKKGALKAQGSRRKLWVTAASLEAYLESLPDWQP